MQFFFRFFFCCCCLRFTFFSFYIFKRASLFVRNIVCLKTMANDTKSEWHVCSRKIIISFSSILLLNKCKNLLKCSFPLLHLRRCWQRLENLITSQNLILQHFPSPLKKVASACSRVAKWNDAVDMTSNGLKNKSDVSIKARKLLVLA